MLQHLFQTWMQLTHTGGYAGVFFITLVAFTVFPIPLEIIVPSAAYWAAQGETRFWGVVAVATLGCWAGASIAYVILRRIGRPLILRYGRFVFVPEKKWLLAEAWILHYSAMGVFFAELLPVVRHLIALPAGAARMRFSTFSFAFLAGALIENTVLAWFGVQVLGAHRDLLTNPEGLAHAIKAKLVLLVLGVLVTVALYVLVDLLGRRARAATAVVAASDADSERPVG
ncbi:MAG TPA: DedA family protein [Candidatus Acidoferrales bacterium]|nr:DedA family protein [Candidatus Acidoferrales bacterium]